MRDYVDDALAYHQTQGKLTGQGSEDEVAPPDPPAMPRPLQLYLQCQEYHTLLVAGGLLDQPYLLWRAVTVAGRAYDDYRAAQDALHANTGEPTQ